MILSKSEAQDIKQVQLLNMIDYIIYQAKPGDVIVVHGYDMILTQVAKYLVETIKAAQKMVLNLSLHLIQYKHR